jgi:peroxin-14
MRRLADALAKGLEGQKAATENRVRDLTSEVRSLKTLVAARVGGPSGAVAAAATPAVAGTAATTAGAAATPAATNGEAKSPAPAAAAANGTAATTANAGTSTTPPAAAPQPQAFPRFGSGKPAAIPAWQMAAAKKASQETLRDEAAQAARAAAKREDAERGLQAQVEEEGEAVSGAA